MVNRARDWWDRLGRNNQIILVASSVGVLIALIGFIVWAGTPEYVPLFSNLSAQDANAITEKLRDGGVPFRLTQGGTAIEVPAQSHDEWQMKLISQNLPSQSSNGQIDSGDDVLKGATPMDTTEMTDLRMRRALEERVAHTIATMDPIASATVHYAAQDNNPLVLGNHDASASVFVTLKPGHQLSDENVRAIVRLTQMSYTGLVDKNISLVDSMGNLLWDGLHTGGVQDDELHKQEREMAMQKRSDLQMALDRTLGPHKSIVLTQVELDAAETKEHDVETLPGAVTQKVDEVEQLNGQGTGNRAAVGAMGNLNGAPTPGIPTYPAAAATNSPNSNYKHENKMTSYQPGTREVDKSAVPGQIKKLAVSVLLDSSKIPAADLAATEQTIKQTVETLVGYDANDATHSRLVSVSSVAFDHQEEQAAAKAEAEAASADNTRRIAALLVPFLIMMAALFILARALRKPRRYAPARQLAIAGGGEMGAGGPLMLDADNLPLSGLMVTGAEDDGPPIALNSANGAPRTFEVIKEAFDANLESILHLTRSKPEMVAMLIKSWISEDQ